LLRLQYSSKINSYIQNIAKREASRKFKKKNLKYLKGNSNKLATNSKCKNIRDLYRGINEFMRFFQPRNNIVKVENGDLLADSHNILNR
jgi:hypothetical protein